MRSDMMVMDADNIMVHLHQYFETPSNKLRGLFNYYISTRLSIRLQTLSSSRYMHPMTSLPMNLLIQGGKFCPFEMMEGCTLNICTTNENMLHGNQCVLNCDQRHGMLRCTRNKNKKCVNINTIRRTRGRGTTRGR